MKRTENITNCHAHCFTIEHVPNYFGKTMIPLPRLFSIEFIIKYKVIRWLLKLLSKRWVVFIFDKLFPAFSDGLSRIIAFVRFFENGKPATQKRMIDILRSYYPNGSRFVLLTMDMEYMGAGKPRKLFAEQLKELEEIKADPAYTDIIHPFIFADARRDGITELVKEKIGSGAFNGIKLYPAVGYFPFDKRLKEVYEYAIKENLPLITHCIKGVVHYRGAKNQAFDGAINHPIAKHQKLWGESNYDFTQNFTHPLNYECLLNKEILSNYWGEECDLSKLKLCLGHFGGEDEWINYLDNPWIPEEGEPLDINNPWFNSDDESRFPDAYSWFMIVCKLIDKYDNIYADISYTLSDERILPLLKILLTQTEYKKIADRILFGTDFFVVEKAGAEREMSVRTRGYLGDELFYKIAHENPSTFLGR